MRTVSVLLLLCCVVVVVVVSGQGIVLKPRVQTCGYNNPDNCPVYNYSHTNWGSLCQPYNLCSTGRYQSPVALSSSPAPQGSPLTLNVLYSPSRVTLFNTGSKVLLPVADFAGIFTSGNQIYSLNGLEFHSPSEHTIDGQRFDMEIQFQHTTATGAAANIALLFSVGKNNDLLDTFWSSIPQLTTCSCGNGRFEPWTGEVCDDGPLNSNTLPNACRLNCQWFHCGDGVIDANEYCDNGPLNSNTVPNACRPGCTLPYCGDAVVDPNNNEFCDDGNNINGDGCSSHCTLEDTCGNGVIDVGEECDNGLLNSNTLPDACRLNCVLAYCGDGVVDVEEQCDAGVWALSTNSSNLCRTTCTLPYCGDLIVDDLMGEMCDDLTSACDECRLLCGNGIVDTNEACDLGPNNNNLIPNRCRTNCQNPSCGDGTTDAGEQCDDGVLLNGLLGARCNSSCFILCGNGVLNPGEQCDNGPLNSNTVPDACRTDCRLPVCGDGVIDTAHGEQCDTILATAFCRGNCKLPLCGDGVLDSYYGEECDDGNLKNGDGCSQLCLNECGNGIFDGWEQCDNGPLNSNVVRDACRTNCLRSRCGDGTSDSGEECDTGVANSNLPNSCRLDCQLPFCGDGIVDPAYGEACDEGILNSDTVVDGCSTTCVPNQCRQVISESMVDFSSMIPQYCEKGYYTYIGSQTTPPCLEGVNWFVIGQIQTISRDQLRVLQSAISANSRPTQPLGTRMVVQPTDNPARCGNGVLEAGEQCDDPTGNSNTQPNRCRTNCLLPYCGDGVVDCGEQCDGGQTCDTDCTYGNVQRGNRTQVNMFFANLVPYNYFCCNAQPPAQACSPCANACYSQPV